MSSSEDDLQIIGSKKVQDKHDNESSSEDDERQVAPAKKAVAA